MASQPATGYGSHVFMCAIQYQCCCEVAQFTRSALPSCLARARTESLLKTYYVLNDVPGADLTGEESKVRSGKARHRRTNAYDARRMSELARRSQGSQDSSPARDRYDTGCAAHHFLPRAPACCMALHAGCRRVAHRPHGRVYAAWVWVWYGYGMLEPAHGIHHSPLKTLPPVPAGRSYCPESGARGLSLHVCHPGVCPRGDCGWDEPCLG